MVLDGIWQFDVTGDIAGFNACGSGTLSGSGQVQIAENVADGFGANASTACTAPPGEACDNIPCDHTLGFNCSFADNGDATCTADLDGTNPIGNTFLLGTCTSTTCSITSPGFDRFSNVEIDMTRQR